MTPRCYACNAFATSRDHAPPLCLFPETEDVPDGLSRRVNLITVPACDQHNLKKSKDDEYLMMVLVAHFQNNALASTQMRTKVMRAWQRRPHLATMAVRDTAPARVSGEEAMTFRVDLARFERAIELIARALVNSAVGSQWLGACRVWSPSMLPSNPETAAEVMATSRTLLAAMPQLFAGIAFGGSKPDVFQFRVRLPEPSLPIGCVEMLFYEGFRVCVLLRAEA